MKISRVKVYRKLLPLKEPYPLSFATVESFRSCVIAIETETHNRGAGEATALPGYSDETDENIYSTVSRMASALTALDQDEARRLVDGIFKRFPFAASAIGTALDFAFGRIPLPEKISIPLLAPLSPYATADKLKRRLEKAFGKGYKTVKVKIGRDLEQDMHCVEILSQASLGISYRFDANQGYTFDEAVRFTNKLAEKNGLRVEALEQPFPPSNWRQTEELCRIAPIPLMLDESIFNKTDILRAAETGVKFIKLKLCKTKGPGDLINKAKLAQQVGLKIVLGNGVATDLTNLTEAIVFAAHPDLFSGAFEGNGFEKTDASLLNNSLRTASGNVTWKKRSPIFPETFFS